MTFALVYVRIVFTADASLAEIFALIKFGIAIAAMIRMIATTIKSSIREKPFCLRDARMRLRSLFVVSFGVHSLDLPPFFKKKGKSLDFPFDFDNC